MTGKNDDLELMRLMIDKIEAERQRNDIQDIQIRELYSKLEQLENLSRDNQERIDDLYNTIGALENTVAADISSKTDKIAELECLLDPYDPDGTALCNSNRYYG